jgi:hypothetical protein
MISLRKLLFYVHFNIRKDANQVSRVLMPFLWAYLSCLMYAYLFKMHLVGSRIVTHGHELPVPIFIVSGVAFARILHFGLSFVEEFINDARSSGLIEWFYISRTRLRELIAAEAIWKGGRIFAEVIFLFFWAHVLIGTPFASLFRLPFFGARSSLRLVLIF